jgi:hypothetical protein
VAIAELKSSFAAFATFARSLKGDEKSEAQSFLKGDFNYTSTTVFDTFRWPQAPTKGRLAEVAAAAVALRALRREIMANLGYSLRALYRTFDEPGANPSATPMPGLTPPSAPPTQCSKPPTRSRFSSP